MEEVEDSTVNPSPSTPLESLPFVEVICTASGKTRRFSAGTEAGFAVDLINKKLDKGGISGIPLASYIEAVKEGEEPVSFGPNSVLVNYGLAWKLQTVNHIDGVVKGIRADSSPQRTYDKVWVDANICGVYTNWGRQRLMQA
ncbi:hypothetical protein M9H77_36194 [Catharanthus roseus]|uniref:Uncharacterized protein n=1 Tax=Catharanthus roseus TaxID=4058 RepID=A0ACB9ZSX5_CATRO|nr:hypothetical protein M9H77_36194 [Catharanthus roseus]